MTKSYPISKWQDLLIETQEAIAALSSIKGEEYTQGSEDRLSNFRKAAASLSLPMETIWLVYAAKHWDSILTYVQDIQKENSRQRSEPIKGRAMDMIVYLILFMAVLEEREEK